eukprot:5324197-Pleurochrysis_carterae.AAC.3
MEPCSDYDRESLFSDKPTVARTNREAKGDRVGVGSKSSATAAYICKEMELALSQSWEGGGTDGSFGRNG